MKNLLFTLVVLLFTAATVEAQINISQVEPNKKKKSAEPLTEEDLFERYSSLTPISNLMNMAADANNVAAIRLKGEENIARITQNGSGNTGAININGFSNEADLTQNGSNLLSLITIKGDANDFIMNQQGNNLGNLIQIEGNGINVELTQTANKFLYQQGASGTAIPLMIRGNSNNIPLIIRNN